MPTENNDTITTEESQYAFAQLMQQREGEFIMYNTIPKKVVKKKTTAQILDELSSKNCEVFDSVNKIQAEINAIEVDRIKELALKYDTLLFTVIGKDYSLKGLSEAKMSSYINTLQQSLLQTLVRYVYDRSRFGEMPESYFEENFVNFMMSRIIFTNETMTIIREMSKDLYKFMNDITEAKKKKKAIMGREESKHTVCEDYLNEQNRTIGGTGNVRFEPVFTTTVRSGRAGLIRPY